MSELMLNRPSKKIGKRPYWSDVEGVAWKEIEISNNLKLQEQIQYLAEHSPFYQNKFKEAGIKPMDIKEAKDLAKLPFSDKQQLRESLRNEPLGLHRAANREDIVQVQATSGTSGTPTYVGATPHDLYVWCEMGARVMFANGFRPGDWALHAYSMSKGFVGGLVNVQILQYMGVCDIPIGAEAGTEKLLQVIRDVRPNALVGTPNFLMYLGERAQDILGIPANELSVRKISVGGEPGGGIPAIRQRMETIWGADVRDMMGGADFGSTYWAECDEKDGMHFCGQDFLLPQIINPASGEFIPIEPGVEGELIYSAIDRQCSPLLNYKSGDLVKVVHTQCSCGRTSFRIKCFGRADDMLIVRGINLFPSSVKDVVTHFQPRTNGLMRILVDFEGHTTQGPLQIHVESIVTDMDQNSRLQKEIEERIKAMLSINAIVTIVPEGTLEKPGAQKVKLIERVK